MRLRMCAGWYAGLATCLVTFVLLATPVGDARAQDVQPGFDLFTTDQSNTQFDFVTQPIPADFFGPGSDPFEGQVALKGLPLPLDPFCPLPPTLCPNDDLSYIDTIVERLDTASLPGVASSDVIDIQIVALSLVSVDPIVVTYNGGLNPELWDVNVCLSATQTTGNMIVYKTHDNGGTFDSDLPVVPLFTFTRQSDSEERALDGYPSYLDILEALDVPWEYASPDPSSCRSNFCAPNGYDQVGDLAEQGVISTCAETPVVPAMPRAATAVLIVAVASLGLYLIRRFAV